MLFTRGHVFLGFLIPCTMFFFVARTFLHVHAVLLIVKHVAVRRSVFEDHLYYMISSIYIGAFLTVYCSCVSESSMLNKFGTPSTLQEDIYE